MAANKPTPLPPASKLAQAVLMWLNRLATTSKHYFVTADVAERRMTACAACVMNLAYTPKCRGCNMTALRFRDLLLKGSPVNPKAHGCTKYNWDNAVAARLSTIPRDATAPDGCWRKDLP